MLTRRGIIGSLGALLAAPAVVKAASLMPVRGIIMSVERPPTLGQWLDIIKHNIDLDQALVWRKAWMGQLIPSDSIEG